MTMHTWDGIDRHRSPLRFEVEVTTPHFLMFPAREAKRSALEHPDKPLPSYVQRLLYKTMHPRSRFLISRRTPVVPLGDEVSYNGTFIDSTTDTIESIERCHAQDNVTWSSLLVDVHILQGHVWKTTIPVNYEGRACDDLSRSMATMICITRESRSWDFMPPDIVRPVASTTLGCLITMVHRLGMTWSQFKPDEGSIRASRPGRAFSAFLVRGMGLVIEYSTDGSPLTHTPCIICQQADKVHPQNLYELVVLY